MATSGSGSGANLPRGVHLPQPPASGFDPRKADEETLKAHGLPPRPDKEKQPQKFEKWDKIMSGLPRFVPPEFEKAGSPEITSSKWAGAVTTDLADKESFIDVDGDWIVPCPYPPQAVAGTYDCNSFIGLDGYGKSTDLLRAGTLQRVVTNVHGQVTSRQVFAWFQWYPDDRYKISSFPVNFGDTISCNIHAYSKTKALIFFYNTGNRDYTSFYVTAPNGVELAGNCAEWIMEDPSVTEAEYSMANFGSTFFNHCLALTDMDREEDLNNAELIIMMRGHFVTVTAVRENSSVLGIFYPGGVQAR